MQEADKVSANIAKILSTQSLDFSTNGFMAIHRRIFTGIFKHAGQFRRHDISKKEWVLDGDSVSYLNWEDLGKAIDYDLAQERRFSYKGLSEDDMVAHITKFTADLWQIHPFCEGNTRTTAVFLIQYLRSRIQGRQRPVRRAFLVLPQRPCPRQLQERAERHRLLPRLPGTLLPQPAAGRDMGSTQPRYPRQKYLLTQKGLALYSAHTGN